MEYAIVITETCEKVVYVEADGLEQALAKAKSNWGDGAYIVDADNFVRVDFSPLK